VSTPDQHRIREMRNNLEDALRGKPVTRAGFLAGTGLSMAAFLAACGSSGSSTSTSSSAGTGPAAAAAAPAGPPTTGPTTVDYVKGGTLNVYSWPEYFAPTNTKEWIAKTGAKLNIASYESNDELFAKLSTAAGRNYDLVIPTSSFVKVMSEKGMLEKLDQEKIPFQYVEKSLLGKVFDPNNEYSIPKDFGTGGVLYDPVAFGGKIVTWQDYFDGMAKPSNSGKVRYGDDVQGGLGPALWTLGYDYDTQDYAAWQKAADMIIADVVPHIKQFGDLFNTDPVTSGQIVASGCDSSVARRAILKNKKLEYVLPKPHSELWVDNYAIVKGAANQDAAYSFMQFMLQPSVQVTETTDIGYAYPLEGLQAKLKNYPKADIVFPTPEQFEYLQSSVIYPDLQGKLQELWSKVKASA
jgi:spermidine/putrescine transport system substrate-binding protein